METVDAIMHGVKAAERCQAVHISSLKTQPKVELPNEKFCTEVLPNRISRVRLIRAQEEDPIIGKVRQCVMDSIKPQPTEICHELPETKILFREFRKFEIGENGILVRKPGKDCPSQIVLPRKYRPFALIELHNNMGHLGTDKVFDLVRKRFYWPRMYTEIEHYVTHQAVV